MSSQRGKFLCSDCRRDLPFYDFNLNTYKESERPVKYRCKECSSMWRKVRRKISNRKYKERHGVSSSERRRLKGKGLLIPQLKFCLNGARQRAKEGGIPFNLALIYLLKLYDDQNGKCPLLNVELGLIYKDRYKISIDRIISDEGYVKGNVVLLSKLANTMKSSSTLNELKTFCENGLKFIENTGRNKTAKAEKLGTKIITEQGLVKLLEE